MIGWCSGTRNVEQAIYSFKSLDQGASCLHSTNRAGWATVSQVQGRVQKLVLLSSAELQRRSAGESRWYLFLSISRLPLHLHSILLVRPPNHDAVRQGPLPRIPERLIALHLGLVRRPGALQWLHEPQPSHGFRLRNPSPSASPATSSGEPTGNRRLSVRSYVVSAANIFFLYFLTPSLHRSCFAAPVTVPPPQSAVGHPRPVAWSWPLVIQDQPPSPAATPCPR